MSRFARSAPSPITIVIACIKPGRNSPSAKPQANGTKVLTGVEYVVFASDWLATHDSPPVLFGREFELTTTNPFGLPPFFALHAWAWQANPSGDFAAWNPTVTCP